MITTNISESFPFNILKKNQIKLFNYFFSLQGILGSRRRVRFGDPSTPRSRTTRINFLCQFIGLMCRALPPRISPVPLFPQCPSAHSYKYVKSVKVAAVSFSISYEICKNIDKWLVTNFPRQAFTLLIHS